jgi:hypothetical protein
VTQIARLRRESIEEESRHGELRGSPTEYEAAGDSPLPISVQAGNQRRNGGWLVFKVAVVLDDYIFAGWRSWQSFGVRSSFDLRDCILPRGPQGLTQHALPLVFGDGRLARLRSRVRALGILSGVDDGQPRIRGRLG